MSPGLGHQDRKTHLTELSPVGLGHPSVQPPRLTQLFTGTPRLPLSCNAQSPALQSNTSCSAQDRDLLVKAFVSIIARVPSRGSTGTPVWVLGSLSDFTCHHLGTGLSASLGRDTSVVLNWGDFAPPDTFGNVQRRFWLS